MSNKKISDLTALSTPAVGDLIPIVDVSDTTDAATGTTKKVTFTNLLQLPNSATSFLDGTNAWDTIKDSDLATTDITTNDVSSTKHGFTPKATNTAIKYLRDDASWVTPTQLIITATAGGTINGATLPVPVYLNTSTGQVSACDGNDNTAYRFMGFAISNSTVGLSITVVTDGIVGGFSGLTFGKPYYVQDAVGTIGLTPGTQTILVGTAISATQVLIQKAKLYANGAGSGFGSADGTLAVTLGFRPTKIHVLGTGAGTTFMSKVDVYWNTGATTGISTHYNEGTDAAAENTTRIYGATTSDYMTISITSVTDTGFTISWAETGTYNQTDALMWEAEGN